MPRLTIRFVGDWGGILPQDPPGDREGAGHAVESRWREVIRLVPGRTSVKDIIESLGVPHTEVGAARVQITDIDGCRDVDAELRTRIEEDGIIEVVPVPRVVGGPLDPSPCFALDVHLGGLALRLRLLGFDTLYRTHWDDPDLARTAIVERRWLLTRDRGLLKRVSVRKGCLVRSDQPDRQVAEILDRLGMRSQARPWTRCLRCNGPVAPVAKSEIVDQLLPRTRLFHEQFRRCGGCGRIFWDGSHTTRLRRLLDEMLG
jgi:uncharacterized protein